MGYVYSNVDRKIAKWFKSDFTCATLHEIKLYGKLRGLKNININLEYPICAFAGKNGCGKTTILALAACAYHNHPKGFKSKNRKTTYYTFSDFFIQTQEEVKPDGLTVMYKFLHNNWKNSEPGFGIQSMSKRKGGKWSKYQKRIKKNVIFLGIDRIVPQTEKRVYKTYLKHFTDGVDSDWYEYVQNNVGQILGKKYSNFKIKKAGSYNMQLVNDRGITYSGFNMGAGEKALFELFSLIYECAASEKPTLIIIDEIELGLHELAQRNLINILKEICQKYKIQIICTTHSPAIIDTLPPEARFYIENIGQETIISNGISGAFAAGRLADKHTNELDIFVEDFVAYTIINSSFNLEQRQRVGIIPVGSHFAVCRQLAAAYRHPMQKDKSLAILDGDQKGNLSAFINKMISDLELSTDTEKSKFREWVKNKIIFLPGSINPEKWIIQTSAELINDKIALQFGLSESSICRYFDLASSQPTHEEFFFLSKKLMLSEDSIIRDLCVLIFQNNKDIIHEINEIINENLNN